MDAETLIVNGVTNAGKFVHTHLTISNGTGEWVAWQEVDAAITTEDPGPFTSIDSVDTSGLIHLAAITTTGRLLHTVLATDTTVWGSFDDLQMIIGGNPGQFLQVRLDSSFGELHFCILTRTPSEQQRIFHTVLHDDGTWDAFQDITQESLAGFPGSFVAVDCAAGTDVTQKLHVCGITMDGRLWHTTLSNQNAWSKFAEVKIAFPGDIIPSTEANNSGHFTDVRISGYSDKLHLCALRSGVLWHTVLFSNPATMQPVFDDVNVEASIPGPILSIDCVGEIDHLHVCVITRDGKLWHTMRCEQPDSWLPVEDVTAIIGDAAILLKILSLGAQFISTFLGTTCPVKVSRIIAFDCYRIGHNDPQSATLRTTVRNLKAQFPACSAGSPC